MLQNKSTVDPAKVFNAIAEIVSRRENVKVVVTIGKKEDAQQKRPA